MQEWLHNRQDVQQARERLCMQYGVNVLLEKCFLLGSKASENEEYLRAIGRVNAEAPEVPPFKVMETSVVISRLHKQGACALTLSTCFCDDGYASVVIIVRA
jgi:hypothetical protein